jgi:hypothetical protein
MTIQHLIELVERKIANLSQLNTSAESIGDIEAMARLEQEIAECQDTLAQLRLL